MNDIAIKQEKITVLGLGYVGLPLAVALARKFESVVGFDISKVAIISPFFLKAILGIVRSGLSK